MARKFRLTWHRGAPVSRGPDARLQMLEKLLDCQPDIFGDLPEQERRNVAILVKWDGRLTAIRVSELFV